MTNRNELLIVSFGTTSAESRELNIGAVEQAIAEAAGNSWSICRCFTSQTVIDIIKKREGIRIDNIKEALERAAADGIQNLAVQPLHLMKGLEYGKLKSILSEYRKAVLRPLMLVAGNHAVRDMASGDDPDSWYSLFTASGYETECIIEGLGQIPAVRDIYVSHAMKAIRALDSR